MKDFKEANRKGHTHKVRKILLPDDVARQMQHEVGLKS